MKKILIAIPCLGQKVDAYLAHSLCESIKMGADYGLDINCVFLANESILPMAKNELFKVAYNDQYDAMVFIEDTLYWDEKTLVDILLSEHDVVTLPVVNKNDKQESYNVKVDAVTITPHDYFKVKQTDTSFLKLSKKVITDLWNSNAELQFRGKKIKNICEYGFQNSEFIGEDSVLSTKIKELGYDILVYPNHTVSRVGYKLYTGDFDQHIVNEFN